MVPIFCAIKWVHTINYYQDPTENGFAKCLLDVAKRLRSNQVKRKDVINSELLIRPSRFRWDKQHQVKWHFIQRKLFCNKHSQEQSRHIQSRRQCVHQQRQDFCLRIRYIETYMGISGVDMKTDTFLFKHIFKSKGQYKLIFTDKPISYTRTWNVYWAN